MKNLREAGESPAADAGRKQREKRGHRNKLRLSRKVCGVFFVVLALFLGVSALIEASREYREQEQMKYIASTVRAQTYEVISEKLSKAETLEALIIKNNGGTEDFEKVAKLIVSRDRIRSVLLAPGGIVSEVYPLEGNEALVGRDLTGSAPGDREALTAIESGELTMAGPFDLAEGGVGIAGRLPVHLGVSFWGIVAVTLDYPEALYGISAMQDLGTQDFGCEIWRVNPDTGRHQTILTAGKPGTGKAFLLPFEIFNTEWYVSVCPEKPWYAHASVWLCAAASLLLSLVAAVDVARIQTIQRMDRQIADVSIRELTTQVERDRLNVLLTQINSHFFYHTLNAIQALIVLEPEKAYKMTEDFSRFLRYRVDSVGVKNGLVPFRDEMRSVRAYADINKVLMGERLRMLYEVIDEDFLIPVLTIQPIVENAIVHGINPLVEGGTVKVSLRRLGPVFEVSVEDNGVGFTPGAEDGGEYFAPDAPDGTGSVGLSNIRERLEKHRGCSMRVESAPGRGTRVVLNFPDDLYREAEE